MGIYNENYDELKEKYTYLKEFIRRTNKELKEFQIEEIYVKSLKEAVFLYGDAENLNLIILKYMKKHSLDYRFSDDDIELEKPVHRKRNKKESKPKEILPDNKPKETTYKPVVHQKKVKPKEDISLKYDNIQIVDEKGRLNLSFLNILLIKSIMSKAELAVELKISMALIDKVLNGEYHLKQESLSRLYKKYKVYDVYELKNIIKNLEPKKDEYLPKKVVPEKEEEEKIEISEELLEKYNNELKELLNKYRIVKNISINRLSILIGCGYISIYNQLYKEEKITKYIAEKLCIYFKVKNIENLVVLLREETKDYIEEVIEEKTSKNYNSIIGELLLQYKELYNMSNQKLGELIGISTTTVRDIIRNDRQVGKEIEQKIFKYFKISSKADLIIKLVIEIAQSKNCLCKNEINKEILFKVVDVSSLINDEYIIFMLLFGENSCSTDIISELLKIDKEYILDMHKNYLNKYKEELEREKLNDSNIMKFKADN